MPFYAQTEIEAPGNGAQARYAPGDQVPKSLEGFAALRKAGAIADTKPSREVTSSDGATAGESR